MSKIARLSDAIGAHVRPGMHLNFASTPSRSNAALRALARAFRGTSPGFEVSATGFHSTAHLIGIHRLAKRQISCFFGDNYPVPRPNSLYTTLAKEGIELEHWSLLTYVTALRAGAMGQPWGVVKASASTTLFEELRAAGKFMTVCDSAGGEIGLVRAMVPDITFVHGAMGDEHGNVVFSPPHSEGFWGAYAARRGVIATVERIVPASRLEVLRDAVKIAPSRVLAVCEEPFGCHPQPLYTAPLFNAPGYQDDFDMYEELRTLAQDPAAYAQFEARVLDAPDPNAAYRESVGAPRLASLSESLPRPSSRPPGPSSSPPPPLDRMTPVPSSSRKPDAAVRATSILLVLGSRVIANLVRDKGYKTILAGIGHSFIASRMAKLALEQEGIDIAVTVETGLYEVDPKPRSSSFLLSYEHMARAKRLSNVEDILGVLTCGAAESCLGVLGAAQIGPDGSFNSTRLNDGKILVGSGGAHDIATNAAEVVLLSRCEPSRLVRELDYVTSPGVRVRNVVTDLCVFARAEAKSPWSLTDVYPAHGGRGLDYAVDFVREQCPWAYDVPEDGELAPLISTAEMRLVHEFDREGSFWRREGG
ncbi:MAG: hypothetical protein HOW73_19455 [Polyangiaceae bacterium]|nr:hypothetical protein [Polyangiaceae bacterium]